MKIFLYGMLFILFISNAPYAQQSYVGTYRGVIDSPGGELAFPIVIDKNEYGFSGKVINGADSLYFSKVEFNGDSFLLSFDFFDSHLKGRIDEDGNLVGSWTRTFINRNDSLGFKAYKNVEDRYSPNEVNHDDMEGEYRVIFAGNNGNYEYKAMGNFVTEENGRLFGTFITEYGDFRFLDGVYDDSTFTLSTFDGAHAFLFKGQLNEDGTLSGKFWSRGNPNETFTMQRGEHNLKDPLQVAGDASIGKQIAFDIETIDGEALNQNSERFKDKPILLYVFGTWCPNCADQAVLMSEYAELYKDTDLEIIGLAFEYTENRERDIRQIKAYQKQWNVPWTLSLGGKTSKRVAASILPFTDQILSFPTTFFADRNHKIQAVHVGFNGPATGSYYFKERERFKNKINEIISTD